MDCRRNYRKYDEQFKRDAVRLVTEGGHTKAQVARELGISSSVIQHWVSAVRSGDEQPFPGRGKLPPEAQEVETLPRRPARAEEERDIQGKALAVFSVRPP